MDVLSKLACNMPKESSIDEIIKALMKLKCDKKKQIYKMNSELNQEFDAISGEIDVSK